MEENRKPVYLEEAEELCGEKLDRYGLNAKQRKQRKKDANTEILKKLSPIFTWLILGILTGVALFFLKDKLSLDEKVIDYMNIFFCCIVGICWWFIPFLIFKGLIKKIFGKLFVVLQGKKVPYELMPFTRPNGSPAHSQHRDFIRCPRCGYKLEIIDFETNNGTIYEMKKFAFKDDYGYQSAPFDLPCAATPLVEHTSYKCTRCNFSFKASYHGEYTYNSKYGGTKGYTIIHTNKIIPLSENVKMDAEAEKILKPYVTTTSSFIYNN